MSESAELHERPYFLCSIATDKENLMDIRLDGMFLVCVICRDDDDSSGRFLCVSSFLKPLCSRSFLDLWVLLA